MDKTIFKVDSNGKNRFIRIYTEDNIVVQESGIVGSDKFVINRSASVPKNIGKVNETTADEQAVLEATAKIKKKLEEGYYTSIELAQSEELVLPMLAKDFNKEEGKVKYPCFVQAKLDGMRCLKKGSDLISRKNKSIDTMKHLSNELSDFDITIDGELYSHGDTFQRNMELIKKYREGESEKVQYHVYDLVLSDSSFEERYYILKNVIEASRPKNIILVPTYVVNSKEELLERHKQFLSQGYEGTMVRHSNQGYEIDKRSTSLLKFKDFQDIACEIVDVKPSEKRPDQGSFICKLEDGRTFGCGMRFSHDERVKVLENKEEYIGKIAEIRFFEYSDDGIPRFPVCVGLRIDK